MKYILIYLLISLLLLNVGFINAVVIGDNITLISPVDNAVYYRMKVSFNLQSNEILKEVKYANLDKTRNRCNEEDRFENTCWQILCRDCFGFGADRERKLTMDEGINRLVIRVIDNEDQIIIKNITLFVESIKPKIFSTFPRKNDIINGSYFNIVYTEHNLANITLVFGNDGRIKNISKNCPNGDKQNCSFSPDLGEYEGQSIYYYFILKDLINTQTTQMTRLIVDTIRPSVNINSPIGGKNYFKKIPLNITATEKSKIEYSDTNGNSNSWRRLCNNCRSFGFDKSAQKTFSKGNHNLLIKATDKAGNFDIKEVDFILD